MCNIHIDRVWKEMAELQDMLERENLSNFPERIYNIDETGFDSENYSYVCSRTQQYKGPQSSHSQHAISNTYCAGMH